MKIFVFAIGVFFTASALAHPGHVEPVAGHTHSFFELAMFSALPVLAFVALGVWLIARRKSHD